MSYFSRVAPAVLDELATWAGIEIYGRGETIHADGDPAEGLVFVLSGQVGFFARTHSGLAIELESLGAGGVFGETAPGTRHFGSAVAMADSEVLVLDFSALNALLRHEPGVVREMVNTVEALQRAAEAVRSRPLGESVGKSPVMTSWR